MKFIIVGGPPSTGKTSVLIHAIHHLKSKGNKCMVVKLDCLVANDSEQYKKHKIKCITGLSTFVCPDHYLASNLERITNYGIKQHFDYVFVESAGLCNRCSPHLRHTLGVTLLDMISGIHAPQKSGPILKSADVIVLTKGDMISQAEREVFRMKIGVMNRTAKTVEINGNTGQNSSILARLFESAPYFDPSVALHLKFPMPGAVCSFCLGEQRVGETYASGNVKLLDIS